MIGDRQSPPCIKMILVITALLLFGDNPLHAGVSIGEQVPDFTAYDTFNNASKLSDYRGKFVVLEWVSHDCEFCWKFYNSGIMQNMQKIYRDKNVVWLTINSSVHGQLGHYHPKEAREIMEKKGANATAMILDYEGVLARQLGATTTPQVFIINPVGQLIYRGAVDDFPSNNPIHVKRATINYVMHALDEALAGYPVTYPSTKAYGSTIKFSLSSRYSSGLQQK